MQEHPMHAEEHPEKTRNKRRCMTRSYAVMLLEEEKMVLDSIQRSRKLVFLLKKQSLFMSST